MPAPVPAARDAELQARAGGERQGERGRRHGGRGHRARQPAPAPGLPPEEGGRELAPGEPGRLMATVVVKLGSSIVADDAGEARMDVLGPVCQEVAERHGAGDRIVLVTSGAIARGRLEMGLSAKPTAMAELQASSAVGQGKLYRVYDELLAARGLRSAQVLLTFFDMSARTHYLNARHTLQKLLEWRGVAGVKKDNKTPTHASSFGGNDTPAAQLAILLGAELLLLLTDTDG